MAIEVLVSARDQGEVGLKKSGDMLVAKLVGAPWGAAEQGAVVVIEDTELEAELQQLQAAGEANPIIVHPYAEYEEITEGPPEDRQKRVVMVNRSQAYVDIDAMHPSRRDRLRHPRRGGRPIPADAVSIKTRDKETQGGVAQPKRRKPANRGRGRN